MATLDNQPNNQSNNESSTTQNSRKQGKEAWTTCVMLMCSCAHATCLPASSLFLAYRFVSQMLHSLQLSVNNEFTHATVHTSVVHMTCGMFNNACQKLTVFFPARSWLHKLLRAEACIVSTCLLSGLLPGCTNCSAKNTFKTLPTHRAHEFE